MQAAGSSRQGGRKIKVTPRLKPPTANQMATSLATRVDHPVSEGSDFGDPDPNSLLMEASVVKNDFSAYELSAEGIRINVRCPHMVLAEDGEGISVGPRGNQGRALFPCQAISIPDEQFDDLAEDEQCRCIQDADGTIWYVRTSDVDIVADVGPNKVTFVNAFLANKVEIANLPTKANCDFILMSPTDQEAWRSHLCAQGKQAYKDVHVLLRTLRKTQKGSNYCLPFTPMMSLKQIQEEEAEKLRQEEADRALDSDYSDVGRLKKKRKASPDKGGDVTNVKRTSNRSKESGDQTRADALFTGRIHAWENQLFGKIDHMTARNEHVADAIRAFQTTYTGQIPHLVQSVCTMESKLDSLQEEIQTLTEKVIHFEENVPQVREGVARTSDVETVSGQVRLIKRLVTQNTVTLEVIKALLRRNFPEEDSPVVQTLTNVAKVATLEIVADDNLVIEDGEVAADYGELDA